MQKSATPSCSIWPAAGAVGAVGNVAIATFLIGTASQATFVQAVVGAVGGPLDRDDPAHRVVPVHGVHIGVSVHGPAHPAFDGTLPHPGESCHAPAAEGPD